MGGSAVYRFHAGRLPLLVSVPHDGRDLPGDVRARLTESARTLPDTDWHVARLYDFVAEFGASLLVANVSRYVVDLNRPATDESLYPGQATTGVCPATDFSGRSIYRDGSAVDDSERARRIERYWRPYHDRLAEELDRLRREFGYALVWDAHSIASRVPRLFDGELPMLNLGSNGGQACDPGMLAAIEPVLAESGFSFVVDGRFRGGYITRQYGQPGNGVCALQLELAQRGYMDEETLRYDSDKAERLRVTLVALLTAYLQAAENRGKHDG